MAESFSHKWGQIIGNLIQEFIRERLQEVANQHSLYLDYQEFQNKIAQWNNLSTQDIANIKNQLLSLEKAQIDSFINTLEQSFSRRVQGVTVIALHGLSQQIATVEQAIEYVQNYPNNQPTSAPALKYEIDIRYNNGDVIHAIFQSKAEAIQFLRTFA